MIAYCGLKCDSCPIFLATLEPDQFLQQSKRKSIAETINSLYGLNYQLEDITDCDGCITNTGRIFTGCINCKVKTCARSKYLENCAYCTKYPCKILKKNFLCEPESQKRLEEIRESFYGKHNSES